MLTAYLNILVIFLLMFVGYFLSYKQWFSNRTADVFSKLVLNLALPFNMFLTITDNFSKDEFLSLFRGMIIPIFSMLLTLLLSLGYRRLFHVKKSRKGTFTTIFTCSNTIFIGLPINLAIFGEKAVPYVLLYYIVNTSIFWTLGIYFIALDDPNIKEATVAFHPLVALKKVFSPALLGFLIGLGWMLLNIKVPGFIADFGHYLADLTTPLSMFVIGIIVYFHGIKNLKLNKDIIGVLLGRYLFSPLIVWLLGQWIAVPTLMLQVFMIQAAMPVQNSIPILARNYHADEEFAASSLGYSVLLYLLYIPFLLQVIYMV
ncbi:AEC family transporter [Tetragenococcus koreensis]|uniref:Malate permease n=1 Tax=Tetragenococcus koreensis TaxID=290335 RepID=A0AAN4RKK7_9ENTE|nr:AEC family transporter [Tetragenococcus koreensis]MCF1585935.1 AEC family transporter [Tetragenococcus koreensis]MCF1615505.1 AEC family transporter [Tetragenococcus koreensis]MCF1617025.1 AEC family transporter [Tetragenococcus koreensis]MCF1620081.1 AEC family transporter [Tetragenococcus koreensis]MCF1621884.1 AEC family transporter [Tetragenococcus koreensis]